MTEEWMDTRDGQQKGPQQHAEGQHGEKTHSHFLEQIHRPMRGEDDESGNGGETESGEVDRQRS
jgi:hypothetical protein